MQVEDHGHANQPERERGKDQEVRQCVDLDQPIAAPPVGAGQREPGAHEEGEVLDEVVQGPAP